MVILIEIKNAFVLAGGKGTRLGGKTPKVLRKIKGKMILQHQINLLEKYGAENILFGLGVESKTIAKAIDSFRSTARLSYICEDSPLGTAGALRNAFEYLPDFFKHDFVMMNGDELKEVDFDKLTDIFHKNNSTITIALKRVKNVSDYGVVEMNKNLIVKFVEKPSLEEAPSNLVNAGAYYMSSMVPHFISDLTFSLEREIFPDVVKQSGLHGSDCVKRWYPTDTPEKLSVARRRWKGIKSWG